MDKIDYNYNNAPIFKKYGRFLPFVIYETPKNILVEEEEKERYYNDKFFIQVKPYVKGSYKQSFYMYGGIAAMFILIFPISYMIRDKVLLLPVGYYITFLLLGLPFIILAFKNWKTHLKMPENEYITFDRLNSLLTMPKMNHVDYFTIPFNHLKAIRRAMARSRYTYMGKELHFFNDTRPWRPWRGDNYLILKLYGEVYNRWSFYVWYMDKNRPLPPLPFFDDYREKDFERRKSEGFPPPLFKSLVPTPEATPQQQAIRDNFWRDEDYMASKRESHFSINPFDKHYKGFGGSEIDEDSFDDKKY